CPRSRSTCKSARCHKTGRGFGGRAAPAAEAGRAQPSWRRFAVRVCSRSLDRHIATGIRRLLDGIDKPVQVDRGRESRLMAFAVADRPGELRVQLADVERFA